MNNWNKDFFNQLYYELFMYRDKDKVDFETEIIRQLTKLSPQSKIGDFCCGVGDILKSFEDKGYQTYGVDFSTDYVNIAHKKYQQKNVVHGNALTYDFKQQFDLTINWFSSFGYFSEEQNILLLENMYKHTKIGGKIIIELFNSYDVIRNFKEQFEYTKEYQGKTIYITRNSKLDLNQRRLEQLWSFKMNNDIKTMNTSNHFYFIDELITKLQSVCFKNIDCYERPETDLIFKEATIFSKRLIFIGEK